MKTLIYCIKTETKLPSIISDFEVRPTDVNMLHNVVDIVCCVTKQEKDNVMKKCRIRDTCVTPRHFTFLILHRKYYWSLYRISRAFNMAGYPKMFNHATILHGIKSIQNLIDTNKEMREISKVIFQKLNFN